MKRKHTLRNLLSMVCTIAMIISMVPVLPAAAAEDDLLFDNMESYTVGTDLYTQAPDKYTQKSPSWNAVKDAGGSATVVADPLNSKNKVIAVTTVGGDSKRYVLATAPELNSDYTLQFDYMPGDAEGNPNSGFMDVYINSGNAHNARIASGLYNTYFNLDKANCSNTIKNAELDMKNIWYSVRVVVTAGQYVMEIWEKGNEDTKLTCTTTKGTKAVSKAHVEFCIGPYLESQGVANTADPITNYIDNIRITPGVAEAEDPSAAGSGTGDVSVAGGGMIEFVDEYIIENKDAVAVTAGMGIFSGKDGNRFDPLGQLTRAEMATVIVKMLRGNAFNADNFKGVKTFTDTADYQGGWAEGYINACVQLGIVSGYGDGTFKPGNPVTTAEALTMIINALKVDAGQGEWPATIMAKAQDMELYGDLDVKPGTYDALTRDQLAVLVYEGMCYSPSDITGWIVDGVNSDIVFTSYGEAMKAARDDLSKIHEVMGEDTLASKIYDMKIVEGFVYSNQESSADKFTTIITMDGESETITKLNMNTGLDKIGHYVTVYYREAWNGDKDPGVVYNYVDKNEVIAVEKDITTSKDYKETFYEKCDAADSVALFDGSYNFVDYASIDDIYTAGSEAAAGTYFVYEGEIVGYMEPVTVYAAKVEAVNDYDGNETIRLSGVTDEIENNEDEDYVREYKGIKEGDYVLYTKVGEGDDAIYVLTQAIEVKGAVSKKTTNKDGDSVVTVNGVQYVQFAGSNANEYNNIDKFNTGDRTTAFSGDWSGTYVLYITEDGKYIGFEESQGVMSISQTVFILGEMIKDTKDSYGKSIRKTYARGVDMSGNEVMLLIAVQKNGETYESGYFAESANDADNIWDPSYEEEFNKSLPGKAFYTYELSNDSKAKKEDIYKLTAYPTTYDEDTAPIYAGSLHVNPSAKYYFNGGTFNSLLTYNSSSIIFMTLEGELTQNEPLTGTVQKVWSTGGNTTGAVMERYFLFSRGDDGNQLMEAAVVISEDLKSSNTVVYVSEAGLASAGGTADGTAYTVYDYMTGAKKEIVLDKESEPFTSAGYWHLNPVEDSTTYTNAGKVIDTGAFSYSSEPNEAMTTLDQLYSENILHNQVVYSLINNQLSTAYAAAPGVEIMSRGQKATGGIVVDTRTEDQIKSDGMGKITSLARIQSLAETNPEVAVVFDVCYSIGSDKMLTIFIKELQFSSTEETKITQRGDVYSMDGREVVADVEIIDVSGRLAADTDMDDLIEAMETYNVDFDYEVENGKITAITVTSVLDDGELFFVGFDTYESGADYTDSVVAIPDSLKYVDVITKTYDDGVKALEVTANGTTAEVLSAGSAISGNYVWETRVNMLDANGYAVLYTTALKTRTAADKTLANFQLQVNGAGGYVTMYRNSAGGGSTKIADVPRADWVVVRVTVTNIAGTTANDSILIEVFDKTGTKLGELYQAGDDYVSVGTTSNIGFDIRGSAGDHKFAIDYIKVTEGEEITEHDVTIAKTTNGGIKADKKTAAEGDTVTLTVYTKDGYKLKSLQVNGGESLVDGTDLSNTLVIPFEMPNEDVEITAEFAEIVKSTVTIVENEDVTITVTDAEGNPVVSGTEYVEGTVLNITAEVKNEITHVLEGIYAGETEVTDGTYTVGDEDVEITTAVRGYKFYGLNPGNCLDGELSLTHNGVTNGDGLVREGTTITVNGVNMTDGFELHTVYVNGTKITGNTFVIGEDTTVDDVATVTAEFWPENAVFYEGFDGYAVGSELDYTSSTSKFTKNNVKGDATFTIAAEGEGGALYVAATGATSATRSRLNARPTFSGSYMVETRMKTNNKGTLTLIHMGKVLFAKTGGTTPLDLRFGTDGQVHLEVNPKTADNTLTGTQEDTKNQLYLYTGGTEGKVASGTSTKGANGYTPGDWYTIRIYVNDDTKEVTVELWNGDATTLLASRILYAASLAATPFSFECQSKAGETNEAWWDYFTIKTWNP